MIHFMITMSLCLYRVVFVSVAEREMNKKDIWVETRMEKIKSKIPHGFNVFSCE